MNRSLNFNPKFVTKTIFHGINPAIINFGQCFIWAYSAHLIFANVKLCSIDCHAFVRYRGRFYDSDRPNGVTDWDHLPASSFTMHDNYRSYSVSDFKKEWNTQPARFNTSWNQIERKALKALQKLHSYEKPSQALDLSC